MGLDEVDVLGFAAAGDDGQISSLLQWCSVQPVRQFATCKVGLLQVTAVDFGDSLVSCEDGVEQKVRFNRLCGFQNGQVYRVAVEVGSAGLRVTATFCRRVENGKVGSHAGCPAGNTRDQTLASAAEAGKVMQADGSGDDDPVCCHDPSIDLYRQAGACLAEIHQLLRVVTFMIVNRNASIE